MSEIPSGEPGWKSVAERNDTDLNEAQQHALFCIAIGGARQIPHSNMRGRPQYRWTVGDLDITSQVRSLTRRRLTGQRFMPGGEITLYVKHENVAIYNAEKKLRAERKAANEKLLRERGKVERELMRAGKFNDIAKLYRD